MRKLSLLICALLISTSFAGVVLVTSEFADQSFTNSEVVDWTVTKSVEKQKTSICDTVSLFGGYNVFGAEAGATKSYNSGVDHNELFISFDLYTLDSWDNEIFYLYLDHEIVYKYQVFETVSSARPVNCGIGANLDRIVAVGIKIPHYRRDFTIALTSTLDEPANNESWGIRDLYIVASYDPTLKVVAQEFKDSNFQKSLDGWEIIGVDKGKEFTQCGTYNLFGGYNTFGKGTVVQKKYTKLPDHYGVIVNFDLLLIDTPDAGDYVTFIVEGQKYIYKPDGKNVEGLKNFCGGPDWTEKIIKVSIFVPHIGPEVSIQFKGQFDEEKDNESFGITNLRILTISCATCAVAAKEYNDQQFGAGKGWQAIGGADVSSTIQTCGGVSYFGLHKGNIQKTFTGLGPHNGLKIFFRLLTSGTWGDSTRVAAFTDNSRQPSSAVVFEQKNFCSRNDETIRNYLIDIPHISSSLTLKLFLEGKQNDSNYGIRDLTIYTYKNSFSTIFTQEFTDPNFSKADGWLASGNKGGVIVSSCGDLNILGGYDVFGQKTTASKTYSGLPKHTFVYITIQLLFLDSWDKESFVVKVDDEIVSYQTKWNAQEGLQSLCSQTTDLGEGYYLQVYVPHSDNTLKLTLQDYLDEDQNNEAWGLRNIIISVGNFNLPKRYKCSSNQTNPDPVSIPAPTPQECVQLFSECQFGGNSYPLCESVSSLKSSGWKVPIKSIKIPKGKSLSIYSKADFSGDGKKFTESQNCLAGSDYQLVNNYFNTLTGPSLIQQGK